MTSFIEMSLDDIIQKNKRNNRNKGKMKKHIPFKKPNDGIVDARNKIISKKRKQITDAREKLAELAKLKDARLKLQQLREKRLDLNKGKVYHGREMFMKMLNKRDRVFIDSSRQVTSQPLCSVTSNKHITRPQTLNHNNRFTSNQTFGSRSIVDTSKIKPIVRTVENDIEIVNPMDEEYVPRKSSVTMIDRKASLQLKIIAHNNDLHENKSANVQRVITNKEQSPPRPPSILKKRPMAALRNDKKDEKAEKPVLEYRIIVSNLRNTVTGGDIEELFGDVGGMQESRLVRPGTAEVIYKSLEDAQRAVDLYHNRQLDGQPMNCLLVTPRSLSTVSRTSKPALYSTNSNVEPDISTFHKVLFSNL